MEKITLTSRKDPTKKIALTRRVSGQTPQHFNTIDPNDAITHPINPKLAETPQHANIQNT